MEATGTDGFALLDSAAGTFLEEVDSVAGVTLCRLLAGVFVLDADGLEAGKLLPLDLL